LQIAKKKKGGEEMNLGAMDTAIPAVKVGKSG
jgi:hypothetical protein